VSFREADLTGCAFTGTFGLIHSLAYSPDGQLLAVGTGDGKVHLWRVADHQPHAVLHGHTNIVQSIAFSPNSRLLVSGAVFSLAFSPDGQTLVSGGAIKPSMSGMSLAGCCVLP
jgi:WD40 repeat protein